MRSTVWACVAFLLLASCQSPSYLSKPKDFGGRVHGLILEVENSDGKTMLGKIIQVDEVEVTLLPVKKPFTPPIKIRKDNIDVAIILVATTSNNPKGIVHIAVWQNLLVLGHGAFMIFSLPVNLVVNVTVATNTLNGAYRIEYPKQIAWEEMGKFARFPQGIPDHVSLSMIK